ncbi:MAG: hypothetical protein K2P81_13025, partial [Bacteriovoracaceae bacterium]|nr:hypothetical protein [Bacteriovoracaceae bacterium]
MRSRLENFDKLLTGMIKASWLRPKLILSVSLLIFIIALFGASRLHQVVSIEDQLDSKLQSTKDLKSLKNNFGAQSSFGFIVMAPKTGFKAIDLCLIKRAIQKIKENHVEVKDSFSLFDIRRSKIEGNKLFYMPLIDDVCLGEPDRLVDLSFIQSTPWSQLISGKEIKDLAFNLSLEPLNPPGTYGTFNPQLIEQLISEVKNLIPLETQISGTSAQEYFTMVGLSESQWLNFLGILIIILAFKWMFGSWKAGPLYFISVIYSAALVYGGMGWMGHPVDPLSICLFLLLSVSSL